MSRNIADLPSEGWVRIDIETIWAAELLPLIDSSPDLQRSLESAMRTWHGSFPKAERPERPWRFDGPDHEAPILCSGGDALRLLVEERTLAAAEQGDPMAQSYRAMGHLVRNADALDLRADVVDVLQDRGNDIAMSYLPGRDEVLYWRPYGSCHAFADFQCELASAWRPDVDWAPVRGRLHSTVVGFDKASGERLIFDIVLLDSGQSASPNEPLLFAKGEGQTAVGVENTIRQIRNARARARRRARKLAGEEPQLRLAA